MTSSEDSSSFISTLLSRNTAWSSQLSSTHPDLLPALSKSQHPQILWLGCSDSRVPETTVLDLLPGDVFVHRNIANLVNPTDMSLSSVLEFSIAVLKVQHVILCGHTGCGGVAAAMGNAAVGTGVIDTWLMPLRATRRKHARLLHAADAAAPGRAKQLMVDLNVIEGLERLRENPVVMKAQSDRGLRLWGLVYDVATARLTEVRPEEVLGSSPLAEGAKDLEDAEKERLEAFGTA